eukprot:scpid98141/ scgid28726/ 
MCCPTGGFPTIRHNEVRDLVADLLTEVCKSVLVESPLAPVTGEVFRAGSTNVVDDARADIKMRGFWTRAQDAFVDIRFFHRDPAHMQRSQLTPFSWSTNGDRSWNTLSVSYMSIA